MTISSDQLFDAILSMDSYNRGYNPGIDLKLALGLTGPSDNAGTPIGDATVFASDGNPSAQNDGFYAIAYQFGTGGPVTIAYRGTDMFVGGAQGYDSANTSGDPSENATAGGDILNGWFIGQGQIWSPQAKDAFDFYNAVHAASPGSTFDYTGHSLGGGLAGLVAAAERGHADIFESMAFRLAAEKTLGWTGPSVFSNIDAFNVQGQILRYGPISMGGEGASKTSWDLSMGPDVVTPGGQPFDRHDSSLMTILMYAQTSAEASDVGDTSISPNAWTAAAKYFWPVMFTNSFAVDIGINATTFPGRFALDGNNFIEEAVQPFNGDDTILRNLIAYSAISSGTELFGDVAIRALFHDANGLGAALTQGGITVSSGVVHAATDISKAFVQFATQMAIEKVSTLNGTSGADVAVNGVVNFDSDAHTLTVNFDPTLWETGPSSGDPPQVALLAMYSDLVNGTGSADAIHSAMTDLWGSPTADNFVQAVFATNNAGGTFDLLSSLDADKASFFVGSDGADFVTISDPISGPGRNLVLAGDGDDTIITGGGHDIIYGGVGNDKVILDASEQSKYIDGGKGTDTADFSVMSDGVVVTTHSSSITAQEVGHTLSTDPTDTLVSIEHVILTDHNDSLVLSALPGQDVHEIFDGGGGTNTLVLSGSPDTLIKDWNNTSFYGADGTGRIELHDFQNFGQFTAGDPEQSDTGDFTGWAIPDLSASGGVGTDFSAATVAGDFNLDYSPGSLGDNYVQLGDITATAYFGTGDMRGIDDIQYETGHYYNSGNFAAIVGTNHGDHVLMSGDFGAGATVNVFISGMGNDTFDIGSGAGTDIMYTGGTDIVNVNSTSNAYVIFMPDGVSSADISVSFLNTSYHYDTSSGIAYIGTGDAQVTVAGLGSITVTGLLGSYNPLSIDPGNPLPGFGVDLIFKNGDEIGYGNNGNSSFSSGLLQTIYKGAWGNDILSSEDDNNSTLYGYGGDDTLTAGDEASDTLYGGDGNDTLTGGAGNDILAGDAGTDTYLFTTGDGRDTVMPGEGADKIKFDPSVSPSNVHYYQNGDDLVIQYGVGDVITVKDFMVASNISEVDFDGGTVQNTAYILGELHNPQSYTIVGDGTGQTLTGIVSGVVHNIITAGAGTVALIGGPAGDTLTGGVGSVVATAGNGDNTLITGDGVDSTFTGGSAHDTFIIGTNNSGETDHLFGNGGNNTYTFTDNFAGTFTIVGGGGYADTDAIYLPTFGSAQTLHLSSFTSGDDTFSKAQFDSAGGSVSFLNVSSLVLGNDDTSVVFDDSGVASFTISGGSGDDTYTGSGNGDTFYLGSGNDLVEETSGDNYVVAGTGHTQIIGGSGNDTYLFGEGDSPESLSGGDTVTESAGGTDTIMLDAAFGDVRMWDDTAGALIIQYSSGDTLTIEGGSWNGTTGETSPIETIIFNDGAGIDFTGGIYLHSNDSGHALWGTASADILVGGAGGDNALNGLGGDDTLVGNGGSDELNGGAGNDTYIFNVGDSPSSGDDITEGSSSGGTADQIVLHGVNESDVRMWDDATGAGAITLQYSSGDTINISGGTWSSGTGETPTVESIVFDDGAVWNLTAGLILTGNNSNHDLEGGSGADTLTGGTGVDNLVGHAGADVIYGGGNDDIYTGGTGADRFVFKEATAFTGGTVVITDFTTGDGDIIDLRDLLSNYNPATDNITDFVSTSNFFGTTLLSVDTDGTGGAHSMQLIAQLSGVTGLSVSSLVSGGDLIVANAAPVAQDDTFTSEENAAFVANVTADNGSGVDSDADSDFLTVMAGTFTTTNGGSVEIHENGLFIYTPELGFYGSDSFTYTLSDGFTGGTATGTVGLDVVQNNENPVAADDAFDAASTSTITGNVLADNDNGADSDPDDDFLAVTEATLTTTHGGDVVLNADGSFTYTAAHGYTGSDSFTYTLTDGFGGTDSGTVDISNISGNTAPVAVDDSFSAGSSTSVSGNVLTNDTDADSDTLAATPATITTAHGGDVVLNSDGSFTYDGATGYRGSDSFTYTVTDGQGGSDTGSVAITSVFDNRAPVAADDTASAGSTGSASGNVLTNDTDADGDTLSLSETTLTSTHGGTVVLHTDGSFTYTAAHGYSGSDTFGYTAQDPYGGTDTATVTVSSIFGDQLPVANNDSFTVNENAGLSGNVMSNNGSGADSDPDGDTLTVTAATLTTAHGGDVVISSNGDFTYDPASNYSGSDSFTYTLNDGEGGTATGHVNITVSHVNQAPVATDDSFSAGWESAISGNLLTNDTDVDGDTLSVVQSSVTTTNGYTVSLNSNGTFSFTPPADDVGSDSFNYTVSDGHGGTDGGSVTLTVTTPSGAIIGTAGADSLNGTSSGELVLALAGNDTVTAGGGADTIYGSGGNDTIDGGAGADSMFGGAGNDTFTVDSTSDVVTEYTGEGTADLIQSSVTFTLGSYVENLTLTGSSTLDGTGNSLDNIIIGNTGVNTLSGGDGNDVISGSDGNDSLSGGNGNDTLDGGNGNDTMTGGAGNDVYIVDSASDVVTDNSAEGTDEVQSSVTWTLGTNTENLTLTGSSAINGIGNNTDNIITGNSGVNTLTGNDGADTMFGGGGNDSLIGGNGNDTLDGGTGNDTMTGGAGDDVYTIDSASDVVTESASSGTDTVQSSVTWTLGTNFENLTLIGTSNINGTGNSVVNILTGNSGNNTLDGASGADTMIGGAGDDTYMVDNTGDVVTESSGSGSGIDSVIASVNYTLASNVENLTLSSGGIGTGNSLDNIMNGAGSGSVSFDGGAGNDTFEGGGVTGNIFVGGTGDDTFYVDNSNHFTVTENLNEGTADTVIYGGNMTYTLPSNVENLVLDAIGTGGDGTGNSANNIITGDSNAQNLSGVDGNDTLYGMGGADSLDGGNGNDTLDGGTGNDHMFGGAGDDLYFVDSTSDGVTESGSAGTDTVMSSVTWTLGTNFENLTLTGSSALNGTGNSGNNILIGNSGANTLSASSGTDTVDGGDGLDTLTGGAGADTFVFHLGTAFNNIDVVTDFNKTTDNDKLDLHDILGGYDPVHDVITNWVRITDSGSNSVVEVDRDGAGTTYSFTQIATLNGITGLTDEAALVTSGNLIVS